MDTLDSKTLSLAFSLECCKDRISSHKMLCVSQITTQVLIVMAVTSDEVAFPKHKLAVPHSDCQKGCYWYAFRISLSPRSAGNVNVNLENDCWITGVDMKSVLSVGLVFGSVDKGLPGIFTTHSLALHSVKQVF